MTGIIPNSIVDGLTRQLEGWTVILTVAIALLAYCGVLWSLSYIHRGRSVRIRIDRRPR